MTRCRTPHRCPHCRCDWDTTHDDMGAVDRDAPFFPLVALVDSLSTDLMRGGVAR